MRGQPNKAVAASTRRDTPTAPGTYALLLRCTSSARIRIGRLGLLLLQPGWYIYVGSALGPGGLRARIGHHQRIAERPHWHIDYLRRYTRLEAVWYASGARCEHEWLASVGAIPGSAVVMPGFGSSDCGCGTHLYWFARRPESLGSGKRH